jgi:hypothetical protein
MQIDIVPNIKYFQISRQGLQRPAPEAEPADRHLGGRDPEL